MGHTHYQRLVNMGRKAGLQTSELYRALVSRPPEGGDHRNARSDGNGYARGVSSDGHIEYRPVQPRP